MINVLASLRIKEGHLSEFISVFKENIPNVLREAGCIEYFPSIDVVTELPSQVFHENIVTVIEKWESVEHLVAHSISPHMLAYGNQVKDMLENVSLKILKEV